MQCADARKSSWAVFTARPWAGESDWQPPPITAWPIEEKNNPYKSKKSNLKRLLDSDAVFLLSSAILDKRRNLELNLAFELDLLMIHDFLVVD